MPEALVPIIAGVGDFIGSAAAAIAPEALAAAPEAAAAAAPVAAGTIALPEIAVTAAAPEIAAGVGTEAALGGGAALAGAGAADAALAGAAGAGITGLTAADIAAGAGAAPELAGTGIGGMGPAPALTGGAAPGATPVPTTGVTNVAPAAGLPSAGAAVSPAEALAGTTGPLQALQPTTGTPFETLWGETTGMAPSVDIGAPGAPAPTALAATPAPTTTELPPEITTGASAPDAGFATYQNPNLSMAERVGLTPTAGTGGVTPPLENALAYTGAPGAEAPTIGPGAPSPTPLQPPSVIQAPGPDVTPLTTPEFATASPANPSGGGQFGAWPAAGGGGIAGTGISAGQLLTYGAPIASLGMLGATLLRGQPSLPSAAQQALNETGPGSPVYQTAQKYLQEANTGTLQPGEQAQIDQYVTNATNQLYQQLANEGVADPRSDSRWVGGLQAISQNAQIMSQQFITAAVTNGINALGPSTTALTNAANIQVQNDQAYQQSIASATQAFGMTAALSGIAASRQPAAPATA